MPILCFKEIFRKEAICSFRVALGGKKFKGRRKKNPHIFTIHFMRKSQHMESVVPTAQLFNKVSYLSTMAFCVDLLPWGSSSCHKAFTLVVLTSYSTQLATRGNEDANKIPASLKQPFHSVLKLSQNNSSFCKHLPSLKQLHLQGDLLHPFGKGIQTTCTLESSVPRNKEATMPVLSRLLVGSRGNYSLKCNEEYPPHGTTILWVILLYNALPSKGCFHTLCSNWSFIATEFATRLKVVLCTSEG